MTSGAGRPRSAARRRPGASAREEILDAAAELFTTGGYTSTSTRAVADAVGVRQASLYHHFPTKDAILTALLAGTVDAPLALARTLADDPRPAVERLHALAHFDSHHLAAARWNLGALYLLPELRTGPFAEFRAQRDELRARYRALSVAAIAELGVVGDDVLAPEHAFRLVESVINTRWDDEAARPDPDATAASIAAAAVRALGLRPRA